MENYKHTKSNSKKQKRIIFKQIKTIIPSDNSFDKHRTNYHIIVYLSMLTPVLIIRAYDVLDKFFYETIFKLPTKNK